MEHKLYGRPSYAVNIVLILELAKLKYQANYRQYSILCLFGLYATKPMDPVGKQCVLNVFCHF